MSHVSLLATLTTALNFTAECSKQSQASSYKSSEVPVAARPVPLKPGPKRQQCRRGMQCTKSGCAFEHEVSKVPSAADLRSPIVPVKLAPVASSKAPPLQFASTVPTSHPAAATKLLTPLAMAMATPMPTGRDTVDVSPDFASTVLAALQSCGGTALPSKLGAVVPKSLRSIVGSFEEQLAAVPGVIVTEDDRGRIVAKLAPVASSAPRVQTKPVIIASSSVRQQDHVSGYVFFSSQVTHDECFSRMLLGAPAAAAADLRNMRPGSTLLFVYHVQRKLLYGTMTPTDVPSGFPLEPQAWIAAGSSVRLSPFPAQVRVSFVNEFTRPLSRLQVDSLLGLARDSKLPQRLSAVETAMLQGALTGLNLDDAKPNKQATSVTSGILPAAETSHVAALLLQPLQAVAKPALRARVQHGPRGHEEKTAPLLVIASPLEKTADSAPASVARVDQRDLSTGSTPKEVISGVVLKTATAVSHSSVPQLPTDTQPSSTLRSQWRSSDPALSPPTPVNHAVVEEYKRQISANRITSSAKGDDTVTQWPGLADALCEETVGTKHKAQVHKEEDAAALLAREKMEQKRLAAEAAAAAATAAKVEKKRADAEAALAAAAKAAKKCLDEEIAAANLIEQRKRDAEAAEAEALRKKAQALALAQEKLKRDAEAAAFAIFEKQRKAAAALAAKAEELRIAEESAAARLVDPRYWLGESQREIQAGMIDSAEANCLKAISLFEKLQVVSASSGAARSALQAELLAHLANVLSVAGRPASEVLSAVNAAIAADLGCISARVLLAKTKWMCGDVQGANAAIKAAIPLCSRTGSAQALADSNTVYALARRLDLFVKSEEAGRDKLSAGQLPAARKALLEVFKKIPAPVAGSAVLTARSSQPTEWSWTCALLLSRCYVGLGEFEEVDGVARIVLPQRLAGTADLGLSPDAVVPPPLQELAWLRVRSLWQLEALQEVIARIDELLLLKTLSLTPAAGRELLQRFRAHAVNCEKWKVDGAALFAAGDTDKALATYTTAFHVVSVEMSASDTVFANTRLCASLLAGQAAIHASRGDTASSLTCSRAALDAFPGHVAARLHLARLLAAGCTSGCDPCADYLPAVNDTAAATAACAEFEIVIAALKRGQPNVGLGGRVEDSRASVAAELKALQTAVAASASRAAESAAAAAVVDAQRKRDAEYVAFEEEERRLAPERERQAAERRRIAAEAAVERDRIASEKAARQAREASARDARRAANEAAKAERDNAAREAWEARSAAQREEFSRRREARYSRQASSGRYSDQDDFADFAHIFAAFLNAQGRGGGGGAGRGGGFGFGGGRYCHCGDPRCPNGPPGGSDGDYDDDDGDYDDSDSYRRPQTKAVQPPDHYGVLSLSPDAESSEIRRTYLALCVKLHPDKTGGDLVLQEKFKAVSSAYDVLSDPDMREAHDEEVETFRRNWPSMWKAHVA